MIVNSRTMAQGRAPAASRHDHAPAPSPSALQPGTTAKPCIRRPLARAAAITAFCKDCGHDPGARGTWREQIAACPASNCALHRFRPLPRGVALGSPALVALRLRLDAAGEARDGPC